LFKKLTKFEILEETKKGEVKLENVKGGLFPFPYPSPIDYCFLGCVYECHGDPIEGAGELKLALHFVAT